MSGASAGTPLYSRRWTLWLSWVFTALPVLMLLLSATMSLTHSVPAVETFTKVFGWSESKLTGLGILKLVCVAVHLFPRTAVLGAIVLTGYLGAAAATHLRVDDPGWIFGVALGILLWSGLYLRDSRIRDLIPLRG